MRPSVWHVSVHLIRHFGFDWFRRLRLIGFEMLLGVLERIDVFQIIILDFGFMIDVDLP